MNKIQLFIIIVFGSWNLCFSQNQNSQIIWAKLDTISNKLIVRQQFKLYNHSSKTLTSIYLHAWVNAYSGRNTKLNQTKLEARKGVLHFLRREDRGFIEDLSFVNNENQQLEYKFEEREFINLVLKKPLKKGDSLIFQATYQLKIPLDQVTKYGISDDGDYLLKYFFLQPAVIDRDGKWVLQQYKDFEEPLGYPSHYQLNFDYPENFRLYSDLDGIGHQLSGNGIEFFRLYLTKNPSHVHSFKDEQSGLKIDFGYQINKEDAAITDSLIPSQIGFLEEHLGKLPSDKLFISVKTKKEQNFFGVDDLNAWFTEIRLFTAEERNALKLFQILSYEYIDRLFLTNKIKDHWLKNGLQYYLMMKYVDRFFPKLKLVGHASDNFKLLGIRTLNFFDAAKLKLNERYKLGFLYIAIQSYDQPINTDFDKLSNLNQIVVSGFKTGFTFYYIDKFLGKGDFYQMIKDFSFKYRGQLVSQMDLRNYLIEHSKQDLSWFFDDYIDKKDRINFKLLSAKEVENNLNVKIKNETGFKGPFQLMGLMDGLAVESKWYQNSSKKFEVKFPTGDFKNLALNPDFLFPEIIERDNYMRVSGLFKNMKKLQFRLYPDVENPKFAQVFVSPQFRWNNYDKFLIGARFQNQSIIRRPFKWSLTPKWSTGQKSLTGHGLIQNTFYPAHGIFQSFKIGMSGQYEHYAKDLSYFKWSLFTVSELKKDFRSNLNQGFVISFDHLNKQTPTGITQTDEDKYGLFNLSYYYSKPDFINEFQSSVTFQTTAVFRKIFAEAHYRWRFLPNRQLGIRVFAGTFINNKSETDYFNFGLSRVSDYAFNINLLGRSESTGVLSQQFVMSEAGFKTFFDSAGVSQWLSSVNLEIPIWKMFDFYADFGVYKNKDQGNRFIYDTGIRVKLIPDFLEFYFPVQSSLGFEPGMDKYAQKIRFTFNLNFSSLINHLRRGWY